MPLHQPRPDPPLKLLLRLLVWHTNHFIVALELPLVLMVNRLVLFIDFNDAPEVSEVVSENVLWHLVLNLVVLWFQQIYFPKGILFSAQEFIDGRLGFSECLSAVRRVVLLELGTELAP